jgi:hypothetical protein
MMLIVGIVSLRSVMRDVYIDFVKVIQHNVIVADTVLVVKVTVGYPSQVQSE